MGGVVMRVETQLSAFLENRAGVLADLADDLARHGISIRAVTVANLADHSVVRLVVSEPQKALHLLGDRGVLCVTSPVVAIDIPDEAGALATTARRLGRAGVNIEYAYGSSPVGAGRAAVYFHVSDLKKARAALARATGRRRAAPRRGRR
ncbi:MAG TPA: amino acid-binding protein [Candidatus Binatia bacterium]|nr:amino acid-binding protein [Candidatus Binatia bacterium]